MASAVPAQPPPRPHPHVSLSTITTSGVTTDLVSSLVQILKCQLRAQNESPRDCGVLMQMRETWLARSSLDLKPQLWFQIKKKMLYSGFSAKETNCNMQPGSNTMILATFPPVPLREHNQRRKKRLFPNLAGFTFLTSCVSMASSAT